MNWLLIFLALPVLTFPSLVRAEMYGEEAPAKQIVVDKEVKFPGKTGWQDHLTASQATFVADNDIEFRIIVKNTGEEVLKNIEVFDYLPSEVVFAGQRQWQIEELKTGETKEFKIHAKIAGAEQIRGKGLFCVTNWAKARAESGQQDENGSQFCIDSRILGEKAPEAGFNFLLPAVVSALIGVAGLYLKKSSAC